MPIVRDYIEPVPPLNESLTMRDMFALAVLQGELSCQSEYAGYYAMDNHGIGLLTARCYAIADAMIKAREATNEPK